MSAPLPIHIISLGCPKNRVDTERLVGSLGIPVKLVTNPRRSRLILINTCAFIESATRESLRTIFDLGAEIKGIKKRPLLVVAGCLPGRYGIESLHKEIPEVDVWLHTKDQANWPHILRRVLHEPGLGICDRLFTGQSYAYLKIAEGCPRHCSYCAIPGIKGPLVSENLAVLKEEGRKAIANGAKELILVAQDTTAWGMDSGNLRLPDLVRELAQLENLHWLRLLYLYPPLVTKCFLEELSRIGRPLIPYFDIPFQHSARSILKAMRRPVKTNPLQLIESVRSYFPDGVIRATLMTGFPGETEEDFRSLCDFVREARLDHLGVFAFQPEEGTPAAAMRDQVPEEVKRERQKILTEIQQKISREKLMQYAGAELDVLVDEDMFDEWPNLYQGHTWFQCPEIDGISYISGDNLSIGQIKTGEVISTSDYDISLLETQ